MTLEELFGIWAGEPCTTKQTIGAGGSSRRYMRLASAHHRCMGAIGNDVRENEAFFSLAKQLKDSGIRVPEIYAISPDRTTYLQQDLGDTTVYSVLLDKRRCGLGFDSEMYTLYRRALADLRQMQEAGRHIDFDAAYPRPAFDQRAITWDLNYFKYNFLKLTHVPFDEERLENDFERLTAFLLEADCSFLLYRDFQTRNIMLCDGELYYIDFQGARRGAAQYDVASLLYSAKSDVPQSIRAQLVEDYLATLRTPAEREEWRRYFVAYVLLRIMQTLGAYGYRGLYERKAYFVESIPLALNNLRYVIESNTLPISLPELERVWHQLTQLNFGATNAGDGRLTVEVQSFSFKQGLPDDTSGNGGGFIFDCRALPNPGRYAEYKTLTGKDASVRQFLEKETAVEAFLSNAERMVRQSIDKYLERHFTHLSVAFGCTGGQHRSVYCAEQLGQRLHAAYPQCHIMVKHCEQDR